MTTRNVASNDYPTIASAMADSGAGDTINLHAGYSDEAAMVTAQSMFLDGGVSSTNIDLQLALGIGDITLLGSAGFEVKDNAGANTITGNAGRNTILVSEGADVVHGGGGVDQLVVDYSGVTATVTGTAVGVTDGGTHSVTFDGVENFIIRTGAGNDTITTADGDNKVKTAGGNDTITTGDGRSNIASGGGNDTVTTGDGGNRVNGGGGDNSITTGDGADSIHTKTGNDTVITGGGADVTMVSGGLDSLDSGSGHDQLIVKYATATSGVVGTLSGGTLASGYTGSIADADGNSVTYSATESFNVTTGAGADDIATGGGRDLISTRGGADRIDAGAGRDQLFGGGGTDTLIGGQGGDELFGGQGGDVFRFRALSDSNPNAMDLIGDLQNVDTIDLSQIDADMTQSGNQAFTLVGAFDGHAGQATFQFDAGANQTFLALDADGDGGADFRLAATGDHTSFDSFVF